MWERDAVHERETGTGPVDHPKLLATLDSCGSGRSAFARHLEPQVQTKDKTERDGGRENKNLSWAELAGRRAGVSE